MARNDRHESLDSIESGSVYPVQVLKQRLGLGDWAFRQMRKAGLQVVYCGGRGFVLGDEVLAFFKQTAAETVEAGG
jgi:hypothetical protein